MKCNHENGWCATKTNHIFVYPNDSSPYYSPEQIEIDFSKRNKILVRCNNPDCSVKRNLYINAIVKTWGNIR